MYVLHSITTACGMSVHYTVKLSLLVGCLFCNRESSCTLLFVYSSLIYFDCDNCRVLYFIIINSDRTP
ncbi:hypothetical protein RIF29_06628 [Crotalaria pallida]|uniref:Uncharacterized protein n=1 Tax=Crotalaria pallida TaxID=3830 RepID=A0AAN9J4Y8_CROPI